MNLDVFLIITSCVLFVTGLAGCVIPVLPGVPLAWLGLLAAHFCTKTETPVWILVVTGIITIVITVVDTVLQPWLTKRAGGSKAAVWGATLGLVVSLFAGPVFIIIGPFVGALIGELINDSSDTARAFKAALGAFTGFILGTGLKMICVIAFIWIFVLELIR